jgi:two-component system, sensor histidine kinase RpfC
MVVNRFVAGSLILLFDLFAPGSNLSSSWQPLLAALLYLGCGLCVAGHCMLAPSRSRLRRVFAMVLDFGAVSYEMHIGGLGTAWLYPAYLWVIFGNGFRFGPKFLVSAMGVSCATFGIMVFSTPFWYAQKPLAAGLFVGLVILPLYALTLIRKLSQAREQAEAANQAKSLFLASVSHELRTPLNAIVGLGALLESGAVTTEQRDMSRTIIAAARTLLSLIDGILDLSRIEAGKMPEIRTDFDLSELLGQLRLMMATQTQAKGLYLGLHVSARTPLLLNGDDRRLREILLNLIANAVKFTKDGGVTVAVDAVRRSASTARLRFEITDTGIGIEPEARERIFETFVQANPNILDRFGGTGLGLSITRKSVRLLHGEIGLDSAVGVGSTFWVELDFAYKRAPVTETERFGGVQALLLSDDTEAAAPAIGRLRQWGISVGRIAPSEASAFAWNGDIGSDSIGVLAFQPRPPDPADAAVVTPGAVFVELSGHPMTGLPSNAVRRHFVSLLTAGFTDDELMTVLSVVSVTMSSAAVPLETPAVQPVSRHKLRVLVADDNRTNQHVLRKILEMAGHSVEVAGDGEEALDALTDQEFDLAIMDVNMPVMNGIEAVKLFRVGAIGDPHLPILALTADATAETRQRCLDAGMDDCITKPIEPAVLVATIDDLMARISPRETSLPVPLPQVVTEISSHPKFREASAPSINPQILNRLIDLGGQEFLHEIIQEYLADSTLILDRMRSAVASGDVLTFRAQAHAIRSGAANLGAVELGELCFPWETASSDELAKMGPAYLNRLLAELGRVEVALRSWDQPEAAKR